MGEYTIYLRRPAVKPSIDYNEKLGEYEKRSEGLDSSEPPCKHVCVVCQLFSWGRGHSPSSAPQDLTTPATG